MFYVMQWKLVLLLVLKTCDNYWILKVRLYTYIPYIPYVYFFVTATLKDEDSRKIDNEIIRQRQSIGEFMQQQLIEYCNNNDIECDVGILSNVVSSSIHLLHSQKTTEQSVKDIFNSLVERIQNAQQHYDAFNGKSPPVEEPVSIEEDAFVKEDIFLNMSASDVICDAEDSLSTSHHTNISNNIVRIGILKDIQLYVERCKYLDSFISNYGDRKKFNIIYSNMKAKRGKYNLVPLFLLLETKFKVNDQQYLRHNCHTENRIVGRVQNNNVRIYIYFLYSIAFYNLFLLYVCKLYVSIHCCRSNNDKEMSLDFFKNCDAFGKSVFKSGDDAVCNCGPACRFKSDTNVQNNFGFLPDAEELLDVDLIRLLNKVIYICIYTESL
jgi:hypothetical protein